MHTEKKHSYLLQLLSFYFARRWQSLVAIFYFAVFGYFAVFYLGNLWLSIQFIGYTLIHSTQLLGLSYLFWGVAFLVCLLLPFAASVYALILCYEIWSGEWKHAHQALATAALIVAAVSIIISADRIIRVVASQEELHEFVFAHELRVLGK